MLASSRIQELFNWADHTINSIPDYKLALRWRAIQHKSGHTKVSALAFRAS
jgi:hypothetical protein